MFLWDEKCVDAEQAFEQTSPVVFVVIYIYSVISAGCLDGNGDYWMTVPDVEPGDGYKIR